MRAAEIEPGHEYARRRAGCLPDRVTVTSVTTTQVFYIDEHGKRGHACPVGITGPRAAHRSPEYRLADLAGDAPSGLP